MTDANVLGPVDYLAVEFPRGRMTGAGFRLLRAAVRSGAILVMDLQFVRKEADGSLARVALRGRAARTTQPTSPTGRVPIRGLLDEDDLQALGAAIDPGSLAGILVYENAWAAPMMQEIIDSGARLLGSGRIDSDDLVAVLGLAVDHGGEPPEPED